MNLYLLNTDVNQYAGIRCDDPDDVESNYVFDSYYASDSLIKSWQPPHAIRIAYDWMKEADFLGSFDHANSPVMNERAWAVLKPLIGYCCEALPIIHPNGLQYFIIHVMEEIDALDEERSESTRNDVTGRVNQILKYALKEDLIQGKHIFRLPLESGSDLLLSEEFRKTVESNNLKGLIFEPIPMVNDENWGD